MEIHFIMYTSNEHRITKAVIHGKIEVVILDRVPPYEKLWKPWITHYLHPDFDVSLLLP